MSRYFNLKDDENSREATFVLIRCIPRENVPLAWLGDETPHFFFCNDLILAAATAVVVKRCSSDEEENKLYIIEHFTQRIFALKSLKSVDIHSVEKLRSLSLPLNSDHGLDSGTYDPSENLSWSVHVEVSRNAAERVIFHSSEAKAHEPYKAATATRPSSALTDPASAADYLLNSYMNTLFGSKISLVYFPKVSLKKVETFLKELNHPLQKEYTKTLQDVFERSRNILQKMKKAVAKNDLSDINSLESKFVPIFEKAYQADRRKVQSFAALIDSLILRELQLRIILLLEMIANSAGVTVGSSRESSRNTGSFNPSDHLSILVDKIGILQSFGFDFNNGDQKLDYDPNFELRQFFNEVLRPFYGRKAKKSVKEIRDRLIDGEEVHPHSKLHRQASSSRSNVPPALERTLLHIDLKRSNSESQIMNLTNAKSKLSREPLLNDLNKFESRLIDISKGESQDVSMRQNQSQCNSLLPPHCKSTGEKLSVHSVGLEKELKDAIFHIAKPRRCFSSIESKGKLSSSAFSDCQTKRHLENEDRKTDTNGTNSMGQVQIMATPKKKKLMR